MWLSEPVIRLFIVRHRFTVSVRFLPLPFSFVGGFINFYLFDLTFDQGVYTAFVLLCVLAVVPALYLVNDFNGYRGARHRKRVAALYAKAVNHKIKVIALSYLATLAGLSPFVLDPSQDAFWFAFAACLMGGLLFSLIGVVGLLPLVLGKATVPGRSGPTRG